MRIYTGRVDGNDQVLFRVNGDRLAVGSNCFVAAILADLPIVSVADGIFIRLTGLRRLRVVNPTIGQNIDAAGATAFVHEHTLRASPQALTTRSISTQAPNGSAATAIVVRAGKG
jgi:hypothetical protein